MFHPLRTEIDNLGKRGWELMVLLVPPCRRERRLGRKEGGASFTKLGKA